MRKIMYKWELFILHKNVQPSHFHDVVEKEVFGSTQRKLFHGLENATLFDHCSFYTKS